MNYIPMEIPMEWIVRDDIKWSIQPYDDGEYNMSDIRCKKCGALEFNVGSGDYFTAIRCPKCGWEECIHEG